MKSANLRQKVTTQFSKKNEKVGNSSVYKIKQKKL